MEDATKDVDWKFMEMTSKIWESDGTVIFFFISVLVLHIFLWLNDRARLKNEFEYDMKEAGARLQKEIEDTQNNLEARGLTFSGEAVRQLGKYSAFALPDTPEAKTSAIPLQQPLEDGTFIKGEVVERYEDYIENRTKKYKFDRKRSTYLVLLTLSGFILYTLFNLR
ncbi:MAG: hypothetical protein Q8P68_05670 [Candidatus Peregrinibacteria bacterium]|nr:hypothetical protein [Candidatus Peregrinibacteria bacterium]MDZ4245004.1 hypothetical protein [Candidatus Gracilibacteria bacterium]